MKTRTLTSAALAALALSPAAAYAAQPHDPGARAQDAKVQYSDPLDYTISWTTQDGSDLSLSASGMPADIVFTDNGDNTGKFSGTDSAPAGSYEITLTAEDDEGTTYDDTLMLTVLREKAVVTMAKSNPAKVSRQKSFKLRATVEDSRDGFLGDITLAEPGAFLLEGPRGGITTCSAKVVPGSLDTGPGPDSYQVRCKVPSGLRKGTYDVTYTVAGDYYTGHRSGQVRITR